LGARPTQKGLVVFFGVARFVLVDDQRKVCFFAFRPTPKGFLFFLVDDQRQKVCFFFFSLKGLKLSLF
jgi:hypothetical protein